MNKRTPGLKLIQIFYTGTGMLAYKQKILVNSGQS
jgi:hypothetical protein